MIYLLVLILLIFLVFSLIFNNYGFSSPAVLFTLSFLFSAVWASLFSDELFLNLHFNTFLLIVCSVAVFIVTCCLTSYILKPIFDNKAYKKEKRLFSLSLNPIKLSLFIALEIVILVFTINKIKSVTGIGDPFLAIGQFRTLQTVIGSSLTLPKWVSYSQTLIDVSGYWFAYLIATNFVAGQKFSWMQLTAYVLAMLNNGVYGGRQGIFMMLISLVVLILLLKRIRNPNNTVDIKYFLVVIITLPLLLVIFKNSLSLLGRSSSLDFGSYMAVYGGAQIKNLDTFLQSSRNSAFFGKETFVTLYNWIGNRLNIGAFQYTTDTPFMFENGKFLGNVYTTLYPYYYDFGWLGTFALVSISAFFSQALYCFCEARFKEGSINTCYVLYGYVASNLALSFYAEEFYLHIFSVYFIIYIILWYLLKLYFKTPSKLYKED